tara:strand:- start:402 stop:533 length:132 start_codon:yes stop_codon:yes gene_type:complete
MMERGVEEQRGEGILVFMVGWTREKVFVENENRYHFQHVWRHK